MNAPAGFEADTDSLRFELANVYERYVGKVSPDNMAVSLKTAVYLLHVCRTVEAKVVADFGSGFTSYVLAYYADQAPYEVTVRSVDDDAGWLAKTGLFLAEHDLSSNLHLWDEYLEFDLKHDVACYDLGRGDVRDSGMAEVAERTRPGGLILFDDAQHEGHRDTMTNLALRHHWDLHFLQDETTDTYGRFAALMVTR